jgi:hypothetical protein
LKTEFVCIFYCVFEFGGFTGSFLTEVFTSRYLVFYLLLLLGLYGLHWIDLSLSFSKIPSLNRSPDTKVFTIFVFPVFCAPGLAPGGRFQPRHAPGFSPGSQFQPGVAGLYVGRPGARPGRRQLTVP